MLTMQYSPFVQTMLTTSLEVSPEIYNIITSDDMGTKLKSTTMLVHIQAGLHTDDDIRTCVPLEKSNCETSVLRLLSARY